MALASSRKVVVSAQIPDRDRARLQRLARAEDRTVSSLLRRVVRDFTTTLQWAGVPRNVVKEIVGHEDADDDVTTLYTHPYSREETFAMVLDRCASIGFGSVREEVVPA